MLPAQNTPLAQLLSTFHASDLGEGDTNAGANLLATMAATLANLAPTDDTILTRQGRPARLGVSLLATGSSTSGAIIDEVITEVGLRQNNFLRHLQSYLSYIEKQRAKQGAELPPMGPETSSAECSFAETQAELEGLFSTRTQAWRHVFREAPPEQIPHLAARPKFLVSLARPDDLENQLQHLRPGQALIHAGCTSPKDLTSLAAYGAAVIESRYSLGDAGKTVRGNFLITDPLRMLQKAAKAPEEATAWLGHFLWLSDGEAGPEAPPAIQGSSSAPEATTERFRLALDAVLARRMNLPQKQPTKLALNTRAAKVRFHEFLNKMDPRLPGISMAARNLIDSLTFGLGEMAKIDERLPLSINGVEALARFLVLRMGNARMMILHAAAVAQRRGQIERIYRKLEQGRTEARKIYRNLSLTAGECDECLRWMEAAGIARRVDRTKWELCEGARLRFEDCPIPLLDI